MKVGDSTPWGAAANVEPHDHGIVFVSTPSHGGFFVPPEANAQIPELWRDASFNQQGHRGWYEEDCDWCLVALIFPEIFPAEAMEPARRTFDHFFVPKGVSREPWPIS